MRASPSSTTTRPTASHRYAAVGTVASRTVFLYGRFRRALRQTASQLRQTSGIIAREIALDIAHAEYAPHIAEHVAGVDNVISDMLSRRCAPGHDYVSARGFVHRDLATRNVLINTARQGLVADFGLSRGLHAGASSADGEQSEGCVRLCWGFVDTGIAAAHGSGKP